MVSPFDFEKPQKEIAERERLSILDRVDAVLFVLADVFNEI